MIKEIDEFYNIIISRIIAARNKVVINDDLNHKMYELIDKIRNDVHKDFVDFIKLVKSIELAKE